MFGQGAGFAVLSLPIPAEALDDRNAFIGTSGSGKTYGAGAAVERLLTKKAKVVVVDPLGAWWGLRLAADGKGAGFTLPIFGGAHGDLPLNEHAGKIIGETAATMRESCIVDLSGLATKEAERRFMLAFLESLYRNAAGDTPMHAIFDEADLWAPQQPGKTGAGPQLQNLMEQIVRRGRVRGFIPWLITQRPAAISKDVLSQADGLIAFKLTSSQDRAALGLWVKGQADEGQWPAIDRELPGMPRGRAVVWLPGRGVLRTADFPEKVTFDSSRTPKRGEKRVRRELQPLDLEGLKERLASVEAETKASDPRALKAEVARLKKELAAAVDLKVNTAPPQPDPAVIDAAHVHGYVQGWEERGKKMFDVVSAALGIAGQMPLPDDVVMRKIELAGVTRSESKTDSIRVTPQARIRDESVPPRVVNALVAKPQQRVLNALAWWRAFGIAEPSSEQVAFMAGYSPSSSGYANLKGAMRAASLIEYPKGGHIALTEEGHKLAYAAGPPATREAFHDAVREKLEAPQWRLLQPLLESYPDALTSDELAERSGYSVTSSGFANLKSRMRTLGFVDYPETGKVRAEDWLFP